ncbi:MAG TPA: outer membrane lipoprotein chaperone LolA [Myxococcota bacterium]|nr:outer membrane lipoprotein chaperone LolA [Myxococcota bacterium]
MKTLISPIKTLAAMMLVALAGHAHADDKATLDKAIGAIEGFYAKIEDFKADFQQVVKRAHIARPLKKSGYVYFSKPGKMRWDYTQPDKVYYVSDGDILWSYEVSTKQAIKMGIKDSELYDSLKFLFGQGDLKASFDIALGAAQDGLQALVLTPKSGQQNYKTLTLWVKLDSGEVARTELVDPLDNVSTITFSGASYAKLKPEGFQFKPPRGATVQDLTKGLAPSPGGPTPPAPQAPKAPETQ